MFFSTQLTLLVVVCLSFLVGVNDVTFSRHCRAGALLKMMDECAGIVAAKYCQTNVVTACLNATNFYRMIPIGMKTCYFETAALRNRAVAFKCSFRVSQVVSGLSLVFSVHRASVSSCQPEDEPKHHCDSLYPSCSHPSSLLSIVIMRHTNSWQHNCFLCLRIHSWI